MIVLGTSYKKDQFVVKNDSLKLGRIEKALCCQQYGYVLYEKMLSNYCEKTDLYFVQKSDQYDIIPIHQLADPKPLQGYTV